MTDVPANDLQPPLAATLAKVADAASAAVTESIADGVAMKTSAAMTDIYSVALESLRQVKIQIENLETALELKRRQALEEVHAFTKAASETMNFADALAHSLTKLERTAMATPTA